MTEFAQALKVIEDTLKAMKTAGGVTRDMLKTTLRLTLEEHTDSIVQLGKVAEKMRATSDSLVETGIAYDKLMKGDGK